MTFLEAKIAARKLFPVPISLVRERSWCCVRVAVEHEIRRPGGATVYEAGAELGRGGSWLEAMRSAALTWTASLTVEHLRAQAEAEEERINSGRSSDQPGLISQASLGQHKGPLLPDVDAQGNVHAQENLAPPPLFDSLNPAHRAALRASRGLPPEEDECGVCDPGYCEGHE